MAEHVRRIDVSSDPDLLRLAEEVYRSHEPQVLGRAGKDLAMVVPLPHANARGRRHKLSEEDYEAFHSAAGGWKDIDTDRLIENIYKSRSIPSRPPIDL